MLHPKERIEQEHLADAYPRLHELAVRGSENPNLMPKDCLTLRMHSIGGWGAITTGKNLATTLFDLLGYHIKANPKYGSEKKGQPTTFYMAAAPEPIRVNGEYAYVDVVLSPDPNVFNHSNALAGLREGGILIMQATAGKPAEVWARIPPRYRAQIVERGIRLFYLDAFRIAREEASDPELELRMQGIAFQGAFFAATPLLERHGFDEERLLEAIRAQLERKFGGRGARVVEDNLRVIQRGFDEIAEVVEQPLPTEQQNGAGVPAVPIRVQNLPTSQAPLSDIQRFWAQTGSLYARGRGNDNLADPFMALSLLPASTALFRDMTGIRTAHPVWIPGNCTACGKCWTVCPDTAIPGLVNSLTEVLDTALARVRRAGHEPDLLPRAIRALEPRVRTLFEAAGTGNAARGLIAEGIDELLAETADVDARARLSTEFGWLEEALGDFEFALTRPFYALREQDAPGSGGLLSITINPDTCKGCAECIEVCEDAALEQVPQTDASVQGLRDRWSVWLDLPSTADDFIRIDDLEQAIGVLDNILLKKEVYLPFTSGDGACLGCSEKTVLRLFTATVEALMQPRVRTHVDHIDDLVARLEQRVRLRLAEGIDLAGLAGLDTSGQAEVTLEDLAQRTAASDPPGGAIDTAWLKQVSALIERLRQLRWRYTEGTTGRGRASMGILNATGCSSVWGSTFPCNPYPFPWANHLFQDSPSLAMGVFEGHMVKMAEGFRTVREAEQELAGEWLEQRDRDALARLHWREFSDAEYALCPPVVVVGGDGAMYDIGFQNLSRALMSGKPLKVLVLDTQVYSNTGGQACTSGFFAQVSDMATFGAVSQGKTEIRKELGLLGIAHRSAYVLQGTIAHPSHLIEGFIEGLGSRRPALFNCYTSCQPEHGIGDDRGAAQARLAVESRAYPVFRFDPDRGTTIGECLDLTGNPAPEGDWPVYTLTYRKHDREHSLELPLTFADFAATEGRFRKHFRTIPADAWHDDMMPLADYLALPTTEREGKVPFIWHVLRDGSLGRLAVSAALVASSEDRRNFWHLLRGLVAPAPAPDSERAELTETIRRELVQQLAASLYQLSGGDAVATAEGSTPTGSQPDVAATGTVDGPSGGGYMAPWIDTEACTACDECTNLNPKIFAYNRAGKAVIRDPRAGPYEDLVKAAERCTARVIHPGLPQDPNAPALLRWVERARKYN